MRRFVHRHRRTSESVRARLGQRRHHGRPTGVGWIEWNRNPEQRHRVVRAAQRAIATVVMGVSGAASRRSARRSHNVWGAVPGRR